MHPSSSKQVWGTVEQELTEPHIYDRHSKIPMTPGHLCAYFRTKIGHELKEDKRDRGDGDGSSGLCSSTPLYLNGQHLSQTAWMRGTKLFLAHAAHFDRATILEVAIDNIGPA